MHVIGSMVNHVVTGYDMKLDPLFTLQNVFCKLYVHFIT